MKNSQPVREKLLQHSPWIVAIAFGIIVAAYIWTFRALPYNEKTDSWGQFGDLIGGLLNPLISLFTLIVAVSVWKLQKLELAETRGAIEAQTFDQFFMSVLASHRAMTEQVSIPNPHISNSLLTGKAAIDAYLKKVDEYERTFDASTGSARGHRLENFPPQLEQLEIDRALRALLNRDFNVWKFPANAPLARMSYFCVQYYKKQLSVAPNLSIKYEMVDSFENIFGHIFRSTYQILKLIDDEKFSKHEDKKAARRYVNLLRAQMSESEFVFFALSALTLDGQKSWARSVRLNFFEDRLQNLDWTKSLSGAFETTLENIEEANKILKKDGNAD